MMKEVAMVEIKEKELEFLRRYWQRNHIDLQTLREIFSK